MLRSLAASWENTARGWASAVCYLLFIMPECRLQYARFIPVLAVYYLLRWIIFVRLLVRNQGQILLRMSSLELQVYFLLVYSAFLCFKMGQFRYDTDFSTLTISRYRYQSDIRKDVPFFHDYFGVWSFQKGWVKAEVRVRVGGRGLRFEVGLGLTTVVLPPAVLECELQSPTRIRQNQYGWILIRALISERF